MKSALLLQTPATDWQQELSQAITSLPQLLEFLQLAETQLTISAEAILDFPLRAPLPYLQRIEKGNPADPLLRQILPVQDELLVTPRFSSDPLQESEFNPLPGLIHKYRSRVLLIVSPACAVNCRYCFRRNFPYAENSQGKKQWRDVLEYVQANNSINEVIFSGGDPLAANDQLLSWLSTEIAHIPHIKRLRVHTRLPVMIPSRVNQALLDWLCGTRLKPVVVLHTNHANEIDGAVAEAVAQLKSHGIEVLNQTVLLCGVNDSVDAQVNLSEKLFDTGILPYYLHLLDPVQGAAHFLVDDSEALQIYRGMQAQLPGFLVPKLVREEPGENCKTQVG